MDDNKTIPNFNDAIFEPIKKKDLNKMKAMVQEYLNKNKIKMFNNFTEYKWVRRDK